MKEKKAGFSLVELLVVIAIIAILAALLFPVLHSAKAKGQRTGCLNNLRQLQVAYHLYADDYNGTLPVDAGYGIPATLGTFGAPGSWVLGNAQLDYDLTNITSGTLYHYSANTKIYLCPSDNSPIHDSNIPRIRSYSVAQFLDSASNDTNSITNYVTKYSDIKPDPSRTYVFADEAAASIDNGGFGMNRAPDESWSNMPTDRHSQGGCFSFADGHTECWKWLSPKNFEYPGTPVADDNDLKDLRRVQAAMTDPP